MNKNVKTVLGLAGLAWVGKSLYDSFTDQVSFKNKVALITGGSKGLGLTLAEELIKAGAKVVICARDPAELLKACQHLEKQGAEVSSYPCDVASKNEVEQVIKKVIKQYGHLDFLFNNAGVIDVGPMESFTEADLKKAMDIMYWGIVHTTLAVTPHMKERQQGHIINITSIGGEISVPHLLGYSAAKSAAIAFSKGCASELKKDHIFVTTIVPGLMRTGSYINATFPVDSKSEFKIFSFLSSTPGITLNPRRVASSIIQATREKKAYQIIGLQTKTLITLHHLFPNLTNQVFSMGVRLLPQKKNTQHETGESITNRYSNAEVDFSSRFGHLAQQKHQLKS